LNGITGIFGIPEIPKIPKSISFSQKNYKKIFEKKNHKKKFFFFTKLSFSPKFRYCSVFSVLLPKMSVNTENSGISCDIPEKFQNKSQKIFGTFFSELLF
jgi:hypothetical protein